MLTMLIITAVEMLIWIHIFNKDKIFGTMYILMVLYCVMPSFARYIDNSYTNTISHVVISDTEILTSYNLYCALFLVSMAFFFEIMQRRTVLDFKIRVPHYRIKRYGKYIYWCIHVIMSLFLIVLYIRYRNLMSYQNQSVVKSNILWFIALEYVFVFVLIDFFLMQRSQKKMAYLIMMSSVLMPAIMTCTRIGNRGILLASVIGILYVSLEYYDIKIGLKDLKKFIKPSLIIVVIIMASQFVRYNRGNTEGIGLESSMITDLFKIRTIVFQDYTYPGNSLIYLMSKDMINTGFVFKSNVKNFVFFLDEPTIAEYLSINYIAPGEWFGIGGFLPTEAYLLSGWLGVIIIPMVICLAYRFYYSLFKYSNDKYFKLFFGFLITTFVSMSLVRGQSFILFKSLYMYFLPSVLLYKLANSSGLKESKD